MIRDLDDKGLGQNKVLCSSSGVELPWQLLCRLPGSASHARETDLRLPAGFWLWNHTDSDSSLSPLPCRLFFVASSLLPHLTCFIARPIGCPRFCLRGSVGLAVGLAIKWSAALPSSAAGLSRRRSSYCRLRPSESDYRESSYRKSTHRRSTHHGLSHRRCNVNKR